MSIKESNNDLLSIQEFASLVGVTAAALRHYHKKGIFNPAKVGVEFENNYRLYEPTQITTIKMIRVLTEIGVPLQTIRELAQSRTPEKLIKLFSKQKGIIADELRFLHEVHSVISTFLELLITGMSAMETEIIVAEQPESRIILGDTNNYSGSVGFYREFINFCKAQHEPILNLAHPVGGYFESMDDFIHNSSQPTRFFSLNPKGYEKKDAGLYLIGYTRGYYGKTNDLPKKMVAFAKKNGLVFNGSVYNLYLFDEMSITDTEQYLLQVSASVKESRRVPSRRPVRV